MRRYIPEAPATHELKANYPLTLEEREAIAARRERVSQMLGGRSTELLVVVGPCAMTDAEDTADDEARLLAGMGGLYRGPDFKPRTLKTAWHGRITTDPEGAYRLLHRQARRYANTAIEIGVDPEHLKRNAELTTLAWKGGRNHEEDDLTDQLALYDPMLPIAVKNGLDGDVLRALADVERIEELRRGMGAGAVLLYRGGDNATTPAAWEEQYLRAYDLAEGKLVVDWAHGGEQAHDPEGKFGKSIEGQEACMEHTIDIAERTGKVPVGIFAEASSAKSPTDPVMSFKKAVDGAQRLARIKQSVGV